MSKAGNDQSETDHIDWPVICVPNSSFCHVFPPISFMHSSTIILTSAIRMLAAYRSAVRGSTNLKVTFPKGDV